MAVLAIFIIGWRSDAGAYLLDIYPPEVEIHPQDLMNLFSLHRMGANNDLSKAVANFNFLRIDQGMLVSWYSGFQSTKYIAKPNYCVGLLLDLNENANKWELQLEKLTYNTLLKIDDPNRHSIIKAYFMALKKNFSITPLPGFVSQYEQPPEQPISNLSPKSTTSISPPAPKIPPQIKSEQPSAIPGGNEFAELLNLVESSSPSTTQNFAQSSFTGTDSFSSNNSQGDPFSQSNSFGNFNTMSSTPVTQRVGQQINKISTPSIISTAAQAILTELEKMDVNAPKQPETSNVDQLVGFFQKKVEFLENKITILSKLVQELQSKEEALAEKNDLIGKLLLLLS